MTVPYTAYMTVWPAGKPDPDWGDVVFDAPTVFKCNWQIGGMIKLVDSTGQEFSPKSTFWSALDVSEGAAFVPSNGDLIAYGNHYSVSDPTTVDAQQIRGVTMYDNSMFAQAPEYVFGTA